MLLLSSYLPLDAKTNPLPANPRLWPLLCPAIYLMQLTDATKKRTDEVDQIFNKARKVLLDE